MTGASSSTAVPQLPWLAEFCDLPLDFRPREFRVQWTSLPWMLDEAHALRRRVFCDEQGVFAGDDRDEIDADPATRVLVALTCLGGQPDDVVGTVRIHPAGPGVWWGSRLAVRRDWRRHVGLGAGLIRLAVASAHALGCREFLANVQAQNVPLFRRMHWTVLDERTVHGRPHALMRPDLAHYPPCHTPCTGLVITRGASDE